MPARIRRVWCICLLRSMLFAALPSSAADPQQVQSPTPDTASPLAPTADVTLFLLTKGGAPALDVKPEEIRLLEDGREQPLVSLTAVPKAPLLITVLVDVSESRKNDTQIEKEMESVSRFLHSVWRAEVTGLAVAFNNRLYVPPRVSSDVAEMDRTLETIKKFEPSKSSSLYDAIFTVCASERFAQSGTKILLVLSDFADTSSKHKAGGGHRSGPAQRNGHLHADVRPTLS